jgi:hypothetical protein
MRTIRTLESDPILGQSRLDEWAKRTRAIRDVGTSHSSKISFDNNQLRSIQQLVRRGWRGSRASVPMTSMLLVSVGRTRTHIPTYP